MATSLDFVTVPSLTKHTATVVFVHGLGSSGHGLKDVAEYLQSDSELQHIKWILPNAPSRAVTANFGEVMPAWFDRKHFGVEVNEDEAGMRVSSKHLTEIIESEIAGGINPSRIVLGGFSQGAAMTLLIGLTTPIKLAGLFVLSGRLPIMETVKAELSTHAKTLPIFVAHGLADPLVKIEFSKTSIEFLKGIGLSVTENGTEYKPGIVYKTYEDMVHTVDEEELEDLKRWLKQALPAMTT